MQAAAGAGAGAGAALPPVAETNYKGLLMNVLGFTENQAQTVIDDGYRTMDDIVFWKYSEVSNWVATKGKQAVNRGGRTYSQLLKRRLQGLAWWATEMHLTGGSLDTNGFTAEVMNDAVEEARIDFEEKESLVKPTKPEKFKADCWMYWEQAIYNYLGGVKGTRGVPLSYVIYRPSVDLYGVSRESERRKIIHAPLVGSVFNRDSEKVLTLLMELTLDTPAEDWIRGAKCGRVAMRKLKDHYDGTAEGQRRKERARSDLNNLYYRNEQSFPFEKFVTAMKACFDVLDRYGVPMHEEEKVNMLLSKIQTSSLELKTQISICRDSHSATFVTAITFLQTGIARIFPVTHQSGRGIRGRRQINSTGRSGRGRFGGRGRGRGYGRGRGRGRGGDRGGRGTSYYGPRMENGVDISDFTRYFDKEEWNKLSYETRDAIHADPDRNRAIEDRKKKRRKVNGVETKAETTNIPNHQIAQLITGVHNAIVNGGGSGGGQGHHQPLNGSRVAAAAAVTRNSRDDISQITFDENGNIIN